MAVPLRTQDRWPIASISSALGEHGLARLLDDLAGQERHTRARPVILDAYAVAALDSFATPVGNLEAGLAFWNQRLEISHGRR